MDKRLEKAKKEIQKQNAILSSINLLLILEFEASHKWI